ncbi:MAG: glucosaminidase domain-containing protein [Bacteroidia bacterium]|nr:glucosaminidase domain-containing protein [Bacteroidia bacterium]
MRIIRRIFISLVFLLVLETKANVPNDTAAIQTDTADIMKNLDLKRVPGVDTLFKVAKKYLGRWAHLFIAIKIEESGNSGHYSWLSVNHYNLCGMRFPKTRKTYAIASTNTNYAIYRNWFECMLDFKIYIENHEAKFITKFKRDPKDDVEMINYMFNTFNHFAKWKKDMLILIKYVHRKYH